MASTVRTSLRGRRVLIAGSLLVTALTTAAAAAVPPVQAPTRNQPTPPMGLTA